MYILILIDELLSKIVALLDRGVRAEEHEINLKTLDYCFEREFVVCPKCRTPFEIETYEQQFTTEWRCSCCSCLFEETSTHTIRREE